MLGKLSTDEIFNLFLNGYLVNKKRYVMVTNMDHDTAYPYVAGDNDKRFIFLFPSISAAEDFAKNHQPENTPVTIGYVPTDVKAFAKHLLGLRKCGVQSVYIYYDDQNTIYTGMDDLIFSLPVDLDKNLETEMIYPVKICKTIE